MSEAKRIIDLLNQGFYGEAWHGPAVMESLKGVSAARAAQRSIADAHTIWELTHHIGAWKEVVRCRIVGEPVNLTDEENFPVVVKPTATAWKKTIKMLTERHEALVKAVGKLSDDRLVKKMPGGIPSYYAQIHGVIQHDLYHTGQIVLLKKAK